MRNVILQFRDNITRVKALGGLHEALCHLMTAAVDCSDILRAQFVMTVSALDHYVHELTRLGMLQVYEGVRPQTDAFLRFQISMEAAIGLTGGGGSSFESEVRERHSYLTFQNPDRIADAVRLFSSIDLWPQVSARLGLPVADVKDRLRLIVDRRNKIAHEADLDPSYPGVRWPISAKDSSDTIEFVVAVCEAIDSLVV